MSTIAFIPNSVIDALGWVLLHSLWQFTALALVVVSLRNRLPKAQHRFHLAYGALLTGFVASVVTFFWVYEPAVAATSGSDANFLIDYKHSAVSFEAVLSDWYDQLVVTLELYNPLIVACWMLGLGFFLLRLAGAWWWLTRLRRKGLKAASEVMATGFSRLTGNVRAHRKVGLAQSPFIKSPLTLGHFKPIILFPIALVNHLSLEETEAILAHELAHITRHDWLLNLLQTFIETIYYFHPAVWWLSSVARKERENCCDDLAVAMTGNPLSYAKALLKVQQLSKKTETEATPALALGFAGRSGFWGKHPKLLHRIERLLQPQKQKIELMEKLTATLLLLGFLALIGLQSQSGALISPLKAMVPETFLWQAEPDTIKPETKVENRHIQKITHDDGKQKVEVEIENEEIKELKVDGKTVEPAEYKEYEELISELKETAPAPRVFIPREPREPRAPRSLRAPAMPGFPSAASPSSPRTITTESDGDGNTIILIDEGKETMKIEVKDGQVIMNGEPILDGELKNLPGASNIRFWDDGEGHSFQFFDDEKFRFLLEDNFFEFDTDGKFFWHDNGDKEVIELAPGGTFFHFKQDGDDRVIVAPAPEARYYGLAKAKKGRAEALARAERELAVKKRSIERQQRSAQRMAHRQRELAVRDVERNLRNVERAKRQYERAVVIGKRGIGFNDELGEVLYEDGLVKDPEKFKFQLSGESLKVNGKKAPKQMHEKYLKRYERLTGTKLSKNDSVKINVDNK